MLRQKLVFVGKREFCVNRASVRGRYSAEADCSRQPMELLLEMTSDICVKATEGVPLGSFDKRTIHRTRTVVANPSDGSAQSSINTLLSYNAATCLNVIRHPS